MKTRFFYFGKHAVQFGFLNMDVVSNYDTPSIEISHYGIQWADLFALLMGKKEQRYFDRGVVHHLKETSLFGRTEMRAFKCVHERKYTYYTRGYARFLYVLWYKALGKKIPTTPVVSVYLRGISGNWEDITLTGYPFKPHTDIHDEIVDQAMSIRAVIEAMREDIKEGFSFIQPSGTGASNNGSSNNGDSTNGDSQSRGY